MKKNLILICLLLVLSACGSEKTLVLNKNIDAENISSVVFKQAKEHVSNREGFYYIGNGVTVPEITAEGKTTDAVTALYPIYGDNVLVSLLIEAPDGSISFEDDTELTVFNDNVMIVSYEDSLFMIDEGGEIVIAGDKTKKLDNRIIEMLIKDGRSDNALGKKRKLIKWDNVVTDISTGLQYSSSRIVVVFEEGDREKMVSDFAEFCGGTLKSSIKSIGQYTFEVEPSSYLRLKELVDKAMELDYVKTAHLDEQKQKNSSSTVKDVDK